MVDAVNRVLFQQCSEVFRVDRPDIVVYGMKQVISPNSWTPNQRIVSLQPPEDRGTQVMGLSTRHQTLGRVPNHNKPSGEVWFLRGGLTDFKSQTLNRKLSSGAARFLR